MNRAHAARRLALRRDAADTGGTLPSRRAAWRAQFPFVFLADAVLTAYFTVLLLLALFGSHRFRCSTASFATGSGRRRGRSGCASAAPRCSSGNRRRCWCSFRSSTSAMWWSASSARVAALDYPKSRLTVQVLDDSTDDTGAIIERVAAECAAAGLDIRRLPRTDRRGFKAGALAAGSRPPRRRSSPSSTPISSAARLPPGDAPLSARRRADRPRPGALGASEPLLLVLTDVQAILLDGHFIAEHGARHALGCFFNFNGTAGLWRRAAITDAGGWSGDTLTEDLDLSYRSQLRGWRFVFLPEVAAPAELPVSMTAFKAQQRRWAQGSFQTARKLLPQILASRCRCGSGWRRSSISAPTWRTR